MTIDIDRLTEAQLIDLHNRVLARLNFLQQMRTHARMLDFSLGETVTFQPDGHPLLTGMIAKYNRKAVAVVTRDEQQWRVSPGFLRKVGATDVAASGSAQIIDMQRKLRIGSQRRRRPAQH